MDDLIFHIPTMEPVASGVWRIKYDWTVLFRGEYYTVPTGTETDGASIPCVLRPICGDPMSVPRLYAALLHDYLYAGGDPEATRADADALYRDLQIALGIPRWKAWTEWAALRIFGGSHWHDFHPYRKEKIKMKKILIIAACAAIVAGCGTPGKVRDIDLKGMYVNGYSETLAIGQGKLTSIPGEREAMAAHYEEDVAWLSPQKKTHSLDIFLVGSNTVQNSAQIVKSICEAFRDVAPTVSSNNVAATGSTAFDMLTAAGKKNADIATATAAATKAVTAVKSASSSNATAAVIPDKLKESITTFFASRGGDASKARIYYDAANTLTMSDGTTTVECAADGQCRECGDK